MRVVTLLPCRCIARSACHSPLADLKLALHVTLLSFNRYIPLYLHGEREVCNRSRWGHNQVTSHGDESR